MSMEKIDLLDKKVILQKVIAWICFIKTEYQIHDYNYNINFNVGTYNSDKEIILQINSFFPTPTIEYKLIIPTIDVAEYQHHPILNEYLKYFVEQTKVISCT